MLKSKVHLSSRIPSSNPRRLFSKLSPRSLGYEYFEQTNNLLGVPWIVLSSNDERFRFSSTLFSEFLSIMKIGPTDGSHSARVYAASGLKTSNLEFSGSVLCCNRTVLT
jgi:hypothetical protein